MHPEDIKAAVRKTGITLTGLALANGLSESACRVAIIFKCKSGEKAIARHLKKNPYEIWPNRYDEKGNRVIGHVRHDSTKMTPSRHCEKKAVA